MATGQGRPGEVVVPAWDLMPGDVLSEGVTVVDTHRHLTDRMVAMLSSDGRWQTLAGYVQVGLAARMSPG